MILYCGSIGINVSYEQNTEQIDSLKVYIFPSSYVAWYLMGGQKKKILKNIYSSN
jgi:hypothetical protein